MQNKRILSVVLIAVLLSVLNPVAKAKANSAPVGNLDVVSSGVVGGWAFDPDHTSTSITVHIYIDGAFAGYTTTEILRSDVNANFGITGNHGYNFQIPSQYLDGQPHTVSVYGIDLDDQTGNSNAVLNGSPKSFTSGSAYRKAKVGIWFYSWQCAFNAAPIYNIAKIKQGIGTWGPVPSFHWVDEPQDGYYCLSTNDTVVKHQAQELIDAGVDFVMWDVTNWPLTDASGKTAIIDPMTNVIKIWSTIPNAPKIVPVFALPTGATMPGFVTSLLSQYPNMQLIYQGKPMLMALDYPGYSVDPTLWNQLSQNYTMRKMRPFSQQDGVWNYLAACTAGFKETNGATACNQTINTANGQPEVISVSAAYQQTYMSDTTTAVPRFNGLTFVKQFQTAFDNPDVPFIAITGWNQWAAQRFCLDAANNITGDTTKCVRDTLPNGNKIFVDAYDMEYSNDMEPGKNLTGDYNYQLMKSCIAKYRSGAANCDTNVAYTPYIANDQPVGTFDGVSSAGDVMGWSYDPNTSSQSNTVHIYIDGPAGSGTFLTAMTTSVLRTDVNSMFGISGNHGFSFAIPSNYRDGKQHLVYVYGIDTNGGTNTLLTGSPKIFILSAPPIAVPTVSILASPATISSGSASTLTWSSTNATSVSINNGIGAVSASGSKSVNPTVTTTYTITATNSAGSVTSQATVTVNPIVVAQPTVTLIATPASITAGNSSTLTWSSTNATSVSINNGIGAVSASGSKSVNPTVTTTYIITATNSAGSVTSQATVTVNALPVRPTVGISASPSTIVSGSSSTLTWSTSDASAVTISGIGNVASSGSKTVNPTVSTTYTITATNPSGTSTAQATIVVTNTPPPPPSLPGISFNVSPSAISQGSASVLSWSTSNANTVVLSGYGLVPSSGVQTVSPTATTTYILTAYNAAGTSTATVTITVTGVVLPAQVYADGTLLKDGAAIYIIEYGLKRPFASMAVFTGLGFKLSNVINANTSDIASGSGIFSASQRHTRGTLVVNKGTVYFVGAEVIYPFPSADVFLSWGNNFQNIVPANVYDMRLPQGPIVQRP